MEGCAPAELGAMEVLTPVLQRLTWASKATMRSRQDARTLSTRLLKCSVCTTLCVRSVYTCTTPLGPALSSSHAASAPALDAGCGLAGLSRALSTGTMARQGLKPCRGLPGASLFWGSGSAAQNLQEGIYFALSSHSQERHLRSQHENSGCHRCMRGSRGKAMTVACVPHTFTYP